MRQSVPLDCMISKIYIHHFGSVKKAQKPWNYSLLMGISQFGRCIKSASNSSFSQQLCRIWVRLAEIQQRDTQNIFELDYMISFAPLRCYFSVLF